MARIEGYLKVSKLFHLIDLDKLYHMRPTTINDFYMPFRANFLNIGTKKEAESV